MIAPHRFGAHPRQQQTRQGAVGQFVAATSHHVERVWPVDALELVPIFWVGARQRAERKQPRHEAHIWVRVARGDELRHLVELREVSRLASPRRLDGFGRQRGKIAVGGRRHRQCLLSALGAMGSTVAPNFCTGVFPFQEHTATRKLASAQPAWSRRCAPPSLRCGPVGDTPARYGSRGDYGPFC